MRNHRKMIRAGKKSWTHLIPAESLEMLKVPVRCSELKLEIGKFKLTLTATRRPGKTERRPAAMPRTPDLWEITDRKYGGS
jgi:hypothetical protein